MTAPLRRDAKLLAGGFLLSGTVHLAKPDVWEPLMPDWVPAHREVILPLLSAEMLKRSSEDWAEALEAAGIPCSPINDLAAVAAHPQTAALGLIQPMPGYDARGIGLPMSIDGQRPPVERGAPALGEANAELGAPMPK